MNLVTHYIIIKENMNLYEGDKNMDFLFMDSFMKKLKKIIVKIRIKKLRKSM